MKKTFLILTALTMILSGCSIHTETEKSSNKAETAVSVSDTANTETAFSQTEVSLSETTNTETEAPTPKE